jgi:hypothetical protein
MDYTPDYAGIAEYLNTSPELQAELERRADLGLNLARALAPVYTGRTRNRVPGTLRESGHTEFDGPLQGVHHDRMQVSVVFDPVGTNEDGYGAAGTYQHQRGGKRNSNTDYLKAAIPIIEA